MKRIDIDKLQPGDIILTANMTKAGKAVRLASRGAVSHAMICVQHGSIIDSTADGVQSWNLQREFFSDNEEIFGFRLRDALPPVVVARVVDFARSEIGTRYSKAEAARSVLGGPKPRNNRQFCSRLVARAYASVGVQLVPDQDYCTPEDLRNSPLLEEIGDLVLVATADEVAALADRTNPLDLMRKSQRAILAAARQLDPKVENFSDVDRLVSEHPEWDSAIAQAYRDSGYLSIWMRDIMAHPYRYDQEIMERISRPDQVAGLRTYCIDTIREAYSGGIRFAINLIAYQKMQAEGDRETLRLVIELYEMLVRSHELRTETALSWLRRHCPEDAAEHLEKVIPHSDMWFSMIDRVEPKLGAIARMSIQAAQSADICSSCGDPARDYRLINAAEAMPGVPSLRLCADCVEIRRGFGEALEEMDWSP